MICWLRNVYFISVKSSLSQDRVRGIANRISALEKAIIELPDRRHAKIEEDLKQINGQVKNCQMQQTTLQ